MEHLHVRTFRDLLGANQTAKIVCAIRNVTVRTLARVESPQFSGERKHPKSTAHPFECPYCDTAWAAGEFLDEHEWCDHGMVKVNFGKDESGQPIELTVPLDTKITYDPWFMDRGSMNFDTDKKICTEYDVLVDELGEQRSIIPFDEDKEAAMKAKFPMPDVATDSKSFSA